MDFVIEGPKIHLESNVLDQASLAVNNGKILGLNESGIAKKTYKFPNTYHVIPGMIDMHIHGAKTADVMDAKPESLKIICETLPAEGTTSFLAATMSEPKSNIERALQVTRDYAKTLKPGAEILGIHLEGPFISKLRVGAQQADCVLKPDVDLFKSWQALSGDFIKLVTVAPEEDNDLALIKYLKSKNIIVSLGHSDADYDQACAAIEAGCSHATHLFNAMRGLTHREPNAVTALLNSPNVMTELIVDGVHLHPAIVELAYRIKSAAGIVLVTDAMRAKCCCDGEYTLGGQTVFVKNHEARLASGVLAGSILKMRDAITNMMKFSSCSLSDIVTMTSFNPAKALGIYDRKGSIEKSKDADLVVLDEKYHVVVTFCRGELAYER